MEFGFGIFEAVELFLITNVPRVLFVIIFFAVGLWLVRRILEVLETRLEKSAINPSIHGFIKGISKFGLYTVLIITILSILGIPTTTFIAVLSAASVAVALALQGNLSNIASGFMILTFDSFKVGDFVETVGVTGSVQEIKLFSTVLLTPDNKKVVIPNSSITSSTITNFTSESSRRVELEFSASYEDDVETVKEVLMNIVKEHELVLQEEKNIVRLKRHDASALTYAVMVWCKKEDYWTVLFDLNEAVVEEFKKHEITIPYEIKEIHMINEKNEK